MSKQLELLLIKGAISDLEPEDRQAVYELKDKILEMVKAAGDIGFFALAFVTIELAAEIE